MAADRPKRRSALRRVSPSPAYYVGYVEDSETPDMIMQKFEELERVKAAAQHEQQQGAPPTVNRSRVREDSVTSSDQLQLTAAHVGDQLQHGTAQARSPEPVPASEDTLNESLLVQVFKQTSNLNVQAAMGNTSTGSLGHLHHLLYDREATPLSGDLSDDEALDYLRGFWSDDDTLAVGQKTSKRSKRSRLGRRAGSTGGTASAAGIGANRERDSSHTNRALGMTSRERNIRLQVVMQYNRDSHAMIRRKARQDSTEGITQMRIPGPPLPTAWGRTIQPFNPALPLPFLPVPSIQAELSTTEPVSGAATTDRAIVAPPPRSLHLPQAEALQSGEPQEPQGNDIACMQQQQQGAGVPCFELAPPPPSTQQWTPVRDMLMSQHLQVQQLLQEQQQQGEEHLQQGSTGTHMAMDSTATGMAGPSTCAPLPPPSTGPLMQPAQLSQPPQPALEAPSADIETQSDGGMRTRRPHRQRQRQEQGQQHPPQHKQPERSVQSACLAGHTDLLTGLSPAEESFVCWAPPPPPLRGSGVGKLPGTVKQNSRRAGASGASQNMSEDGDAHTVRCGLSDLAGTGGYIEVPDLASCDMLKLLSGHRFNVVLINTGWEVEAGDVGLKKWLGFSEEDGLLVSRLCRVPVPALCPTGFVFVWVQKPHLQAVFKQLYAWGYTYVENLTWVWLHANNSVLRCPSTYCASSHLTLAMFRKEGEGKDIQLRHQRNADVMLDCLRTLSATRSPPAELYSVLETMLPGEVAAGRCLELCWCPPAAGAAAVRPGWLQLVQQAPKQQKQG